MPDAAWRIVSADWVRDRAALRHVRETVFVQEQQVPADMEWDDEDATSVHVLAVDGDDQPIGTARLTAANAIGRMAVLASWRGQSIGKALLVALVAHAQDRGAGEVSLHAQSHAVAFYERFGFVVCGGSFMEAGIPHRPMVLEIPPPSGDRRNPG